ncbi:MULTISPECIES: AsmA family protein [unclassified Pseudomonas]|uniref:AsmA family protein n=1 Tax=unclassified Pseudomonas TaxID=196821 RepID=UPI000C88E2A7|nr:MULTISPECIES: AsmA family protein [unclassified Pseudomonas]PNA02643.1 AsmA family protein [Pseudomonas sp. FW305-42]PNA26854.1 AsmA family protein [Pseudomonas sp. MPR-R1B]PNB27652.1 AsmA family protein [Pseudomonas sp. DP16D-E2]PNB44180.1 AsmA family protein [Pseudomonas sp. FW305-17]PNB63168.1 AsmA family protein [Pseudomonas sp. GW531-E2]
MKAFGKILGLGLLGLLLIIVALGFALTHLFDPNDYKEEIRQLARDKAHVELTLNGDIGWSLFPWLGLELHEASIATLNNPKVPFADLQMLGLSVRVLPLLRREVQMSDVRVEGLNLTLTRDANGHGNWEDIGKPLPDPAVANAPTTTPGEAAAAEAEKPQGNERSVKLDIDSLTVNNARVLYTDEKAGQTYGAESIQLSTGPVHEGVNIPLKASAFLSASQPNLKARTELTGELRFDRRLKRYNLEDMRLSGETSGEPLAGKTMTFAAQGQVLVDLAANVASWSGLKVSANQLRALGELNVRDLDKAPQVSGGLSIAQFDLRTFLDGIGHPLPATADAAAFKKLELVTRLQGTPNSLALEDLAVKLDDSTFTGRVAVEDFAKQALRVRLKGDKFDADRYLPAKSEEAKGATAARQAEVKQQEATAVAGAGSTPLPDAPTQVAWSSDKLLPVDRLRALDLQADLSFGALTLDKLPISDAQLTASGQGGLVTLQTLRGALYNGTFEAKGTVDVRPAVPQIGVNTKINRVPVEHFIKRESPEQAPPVKGLLTLNSDLTATGNSQKALVDTLNGNASFTINDGVLVNANLEQQLCQAIATLNRKQLSGEPRGKDTPFQELRGSLVLRNGVASNPDLKVRIPGLTVNGHGDLDLRVLGMDYNVGVVVEGDQRAMPDPACQVNERYVGVEVPLRCRGPLELGAKACRLDQDGLGKVAAKLAGNRLKDKIDEKLEEKLGDKVSPELKDALKGLFKR